MILRSVKILSKDVKRIDSQALKKHKTEPRWSVIERALDALAAMQKRQAG
jgi:hypothetical protein